MIVAQSCAKFSRKPNHQNRNDHQCSETKSAGSAQRSNNRSGESRNYSLRFGNERSVLADLVRRADDGETVVDSAGCLKISSTDEEKVAALAELICRAGDEAETKTAALLVLMSTLENATHPKALANLAKQFAFTRCGELNLNGMMEEQIAVFESELLAGNALVS